jgi:hypothetical protein
MHIKFLLKNLKGRSDSEDLSIDRILKKLGMRVWAGFIRVRMLTSCEHGSEPSCFMVKR